MCLPCFCIFFCKTFAKDSFVQFAQKLYLLRKKNKNSIILTSIPFFEPKGSIDFQILMRAS
jgi:hypothetical protein